jgi:Zn-finger nucleic acid-binding protein
MKCPHCAVNLLMSERHGIEVDYCPECRGVWLDRGELDKILERNQAEFAGADVPVAPSPPPSARGDHDRDDRDRDRYRNDRDDRDRYRDDRDRDDRRHEERRGYEGAAYKKKKKKSSFLEDLFEFGG